jgi:phage terminase large subunit GpA-like protein
MPVSALVDEVRPLRRASRKRLSTGRKAFLGGWLRGWEPEPQLTVSQWASRNRFLTRTTSSIPGQYNPARTPFAVEIMDSLSLTSPVRRVVLIGCSQLVKTEIGLNFLGYVIDHAPGSFLMVQPTLTMLKKVSRQRIDTMIANCPSLRAKVREPRERNASNTLDTKEFDGGILLMTTANSAAGLSSYPIRYLWMDERDRYPEDVKGEGDPGDLAETRTSNFPRAKIYMASSPTIKGLSAVEEEFLASDQRYYFVPCPHCGHMDHLRWENIRWDESAGPDAGAWLICVECGGVIDEHHKTEMFAKGEWRPTAISKDPDTRAYHLNALYSPIGLGKSWKAHARKFRAVKDNPPRLKTWLNTVLAKTWEQRGQSADSESVLDRAAPYFPKGSQAKVPNGVGVLVASIDTQDDRLECAVKGYGAGEESWLIAFQPFHGDPGQDKVWLDADEFLKREFLHESGQKVPISCTCVDSGGHHSEMVYRFCKARLDRRIFAVRGGNEIGKPLVARPTRGIRYKTPLFTLCVDSAKETIYSRLKIGTLGPGYIHLPDWIDEEYAKQLASEKGIWRGRRREWVPVHQRHEALDLEVYSLAALYILGTTFIRSLPERAAALARKSSRRGGGMAGGEATDADLQAQDWPGAQPLAILPLPRGRDGSRLLRTPGRV